jgi:tubulin polyglutamylase TTLL1
VRLREGQAINHFPNSIELVRKDLLVKNVKRYRRAIAQSGGLCPEIVPVTFYLPQDYGMLTEAFRKRPNKPWIAKPVGRSQGKGIFLVTKLSQLKQFRFNHASTAARLGVSSAAATSAGKDGSAPITDMYILSRYVDRPLLIGGRKFDLRLYCLVTSFVPLRAYIHRCGFARFCSVPYSSAKGDLTDSAIHLTNVSIQVSRRSLRAASTVMRPSSQKYTDEYSAVHGGKWALDQLALYVEATRGRAATAAMFRDIREVVRHSLLAVQSRMAPEARAFELYGYDVLLDEGLRPWLMEVRRVLHLGVLRPTRMARRSMRPPR